MPKGRKKSHKGGFRHFTSEDQMKAEAEKQRKEREWRKQKGIESSEEEEDEGAKAEPRVAAPGELPPSSSEEESSSEDDEPSKPKGVEHLIDIENPNRMAQKSKKVSQLDVDSARPELSRREKEELAKQQSKERYQKLHMEGKTDEARADMARLALIRKQREDAQKKRDVDKKVKDNEQAASLASEKERRKGKK